MRGLSGQTLDKEVTQAFADLLWSGVTDGYGQTLFTVDYDSKDFATLAAIQKNVWQFSAAKDYTMLRQLTNALINEEGILDYADFKKVAEEIIGEHLRWLKAEYNLAVSGGQMAGKWVQIEANKETFPLLQFDAVIDNRTTEICRPLDGTILPVDHPFWRRFYPPNHYNCRSTVRQLRSGVVTTNIPSADIPELFQTNVGVSGLVFPPDHPYNIGKPYWLDQQGMSAMRKDLLSVAKERLKDKTVDVDGLGPVTFSTDGLKEAINQPHKNYVFKNQLVTVADSLLKESQLIKSEPDTQGRNLIYHYLSVRGLADYSLVIKEFADGRKILYSIVDHVK